MLKENRQMPKHLRDLEREVSYRGFECSTNWTCILAGGWYFLCCPRQVYSIADNELIASSHCME